MSKRRRRVSRNAYAVVHNRRVRGFSSVRRLARNLGSADLVDKVVVPALGATGGMILAQWLGSMVGGSYLPTMDPRIVATGASLASAIAAYAVGQPLGLSPETQMSIAAGAGVSGLKPWLPLQLIQDTVLPTPTPAPAPVAPVAMVPMGPGPVSGMGANYMIDISHAGAPYRGMFGLDGYDESVINDVRHSDEPISTVSPIDLAFPVVKKRAVRRVREQMATPDGRGWAGGMFSRMLFSGASG